ncbi:methyltransferase domain-containing protein [Halobacillus litoralis]|uniref:methyltransferase domain-containing protein n=1 Tax=Halobacillus litoralis TaxID=45668 RepID=UPI001CD346E7|nr:methyltransferase domain-containing protein [Halobacillus litoralis]MCA0972226.1 methyltransferase domain-containing protein [Halobacillus litoralis]
MKEPVYNTHYKKEDYFGDPYPGLVSFFEAYEPKGHVLDLGCGQGRDALCLGRLGYTVTGVDVSTVGIEQMNQVAHREALNVNGKVGDVNSFKISDEHDIILLDSMLHFYKRDVEKETKFLQRMASDLKGDGVLAIFMIKGEQRENQLKRVLNETRFGWEVLADRYTDYPEFDAVYHMYIIKKHG